MNHDKYRKYIYWGMTAFLVLAASVAFVFVLIKWERVAGIIGILTEILAPIIYGAVLAYLLAPIYNRVYEAVYGRTEKWVSSDHAREKIGGFAGTAASLLVLVAIVTGLISMLIPQLIQSVRGIIEAFPTSISNLEIWLEQQLVDNPQLEQTVIEYYNVLVQGIQNWMANEFLPNVDQFYQVLRNVSSGVVMVLNVVLDVLIGLIVMVYLLNMKSRMVTQVKMIIYGVFPLKIANKVLEECRYVHHVFGGFIIGKLLDSLIIGIMSFVLLSLMNMPYVLVVSVIIGVTNVIPFFGPFIGAIPSAFLILLASPMKCLYFVIFIFLLQQFDGNILGPKILGDSTGLSSFWVLFSILVFGGVFGFVGMIIGVPTFAVFYKLVRELVTYLLKKKRLSADIGEYENLDYIDEKQRNYQKKK